MARVGTPSTSATSRSERRPRWPVSATYMAARPEQEAAGKSQRQDQPGLGEAGLGRCHRLGDHPGIGLDRVDGLVLAARACEIGFVQPRLSSTSRSSSASARPWPRGAAPALQLLELAGQEPARRRGPGRPRPRYCRSSARRSSRIRPSSLVLLARGCPGSWDGAGRIGRRARPRAAADRPSAQEIVEQGRAAELARSRPCRRHSRPGAAGAPASPPAGACDRRPRPAGRSGQQSRPHRRRRSGTRRASLSAR